MTVAFCFPYSYFTSSISLGLHALVKKIRAGYRDAGAVNQPFFGSVWIQLPSLTPSGRVGPK